MPLLARLRDRLTGFPTHVKSVLDAHPEWKVQLAPPPRSADAQAIERWDLLREPTHRGPGHLQMWKQHTSPLDTPGYRGFTHECPDLTHLVISQEAIPWQCEIREVECILNSREPLEKFDALDEVAIADPSFLGDSSNQALDKLLASQHLAALVNSQPTHDRFTTHQWDGRLALCNTDGSHRFCAARYLARKLNRKVWLYASHTTYSLNRSAINSLRSQFDLFALPSNGCSMRKDVPDDLHDALEYHQIEYGTYFLPKPHADDKILLLLSRTNAASNRVAHLLRDSGFFDVGGYLAQLAPHPAWDESAFRQMVEEGTKAWSQIPDSDAWLAEVRGKIPAQKKVW